MNSVMLVFGLTSIMICIGIFLRAKVPFLRRLYVPVSVIAGIIGFIFMNGIPSKFHLGEITDEFSNVLNILFTISFISISLVDNADDAKKKRKITKADRAEINKLPKAERKSRLKQLKAEIKAEKKANSGVNWIKGAFGMGLVWTSLYCTTTFLGYYIIKLVGKPFGMAPELGTLIPYGFCQGPGQAVTNGLIYENEYGIPGALQVSMVFATVGFISAFVLGVPLAKLAIKKNIAIHSGQVDSTVEKGIYPPDKQEVAIGYATTHSGSIDTLATHFAVIGVTYMVALAVSWLFTFIPVIGKPLSVMLFFCGLIAGCIVKPIMKLLKVNHIINNDVLNRITGWTADFVVVMAFMAVQLEVVGKYLVPSLIEAFIVTVITFTTCVFYGKRFGGKNDLERTLGLYGTSTGTTPSGIALIRIVDPNLQTTTAAELGMMSLVGLLTTPPMILMMFALKGAISLQLALIITLVFGLLYLLLLYPLGVVHKPSYQIFKGEISHEDESETVGITDDIVMTTDYLIGESMENADRPGIMK